MKITVVGSGHGGCATAAVLSMRGHEVSLLKLGNTIHSESFEVIRQRRSILLEGHEGGGAFPLANVSRDPAEVIPDADIILINYVANYHKMVAQRCCKHFQSNQTVILSPGYCGSLIFHQELLNIRRRQSPLFVEFETLPYSSRLMGNGSVAIVSRNVRHPYAVFPSNQQYEIEDRLGTLLGECVPRNNIIETALHNPNLVIHTVGVLLNASMIENPRWRFAMYRDGFSASVWNVVNCLDNEKMAVLSSLGLPRITYFDEFKLRTFEDTSIDSLAGFRLYASEAPDGPFTLNHRYVTEDVPIGLGLLHSIGREVGVSTPVCDSLISMAGSLVKRDFWREARDIKLLCDMPFHDVLKLING